MKLKIDLSALTDKAVEAKEVMGQIQSMTDQSMEARGANRSGQPGYIALSP